MSDSSRKGLVTDPTGQVGGTLLRLLAAESSLQVAAVAVPAYVICAYRNFIDYGARAPGLDAAKQLTAGGHRPPSQPAGDSR